MSLILTIFTGLIGAAIAAFFQNRSWKRQYFAKIRDEDRESAVRLIEDIASALENRLSEQRRFIGKVNSREVEPHDLERHRDALSKWMGEFASLKSQIRVLFGKDRSVDFEAEVHRRMRDVAEIAAVGVKHGIERLNNSERVVFKSLSTSLSIAQHHAFLFLTELHQTVEHGAVGRMRLLNDLDYAPAELIEYSYLFRRLVGIEGIKESA